MAVAHATKDTPTKRRKNGSVLQKRGSRDRHWGRK